MPSHRSVISRTWTDFLRSGFNILIVLSFFAPPLLELLFCLLFLGASGGEINLQIRKEQKWATIPWHD